MSRETRPNADLEDDDHQFEEDLRRAIALSLEHSGGEDATENGSLLTLSKPLSDEPLVVEPAPQDKTGGLVYGGMLLDRKKMEEERLVRMKRKASELGDEERLQQKMRTKASSGHQGEDVSRSCCHTEMRAPRSDGAGPKYPDGTVKRTWAFGYPRAGDIKIEEVFQKNELELAVLSSYQWDDEWLLSKFDLSRTRLICIAYAADEAQKAEMRMNVPSHIVKFCFPPMGGAGPGCMHSKLQLLKLKDYLRVVVPSGNLTRYDWGETGIMENTVFLIDLPLLGSDQEAQTTPFRDELKRFLNASGLEDKVIQSLDKYDFSRTSPYAFVHTIGGSHTGDSWRYTGYCGLGLAVDRLGLSADAMHQVDVDIVASSIGSLNVDFLSTIYRACQGENGIEEYEAKSTRTRKKNDSADSKQLETLKGHLRIYYPSQNTIASSRGGKNAAGTICLQEKWWNSETFPRELFRDCISKRSGLLMHNKLFFVQQSGHDGSSRAWAYVGSANLSESAWGKMVTDKASRKGRLNCRNWECGVLVPALPRPDQAGDKQRSGEDWAIFGESVPIPMKLPGAVYVSNMQPWFSMGG